MKINIVLLLFLFLILFIGISSWFIVAPERSRKNVIKYHYYILR